MNTGNSDSPTTIGADQPRWNETLRDRTHVVIRPVTPRDAAAERAFIEALSPRSRRFRFLGEVRHPSEALIGRLTSPDFRQDVAFAAVMPEDAHEKFLGVARYSAAADGMSCECAVAVLDDWHHRGLGTVLMRHLIDVARARGIGRMYSIDSAENVEMSDLARFLGFERRLDEDDPGCVVHTLSLTTPPA